MIFTKNFQLISVLFGLSSMPACAVPEEQPSVPPTSLVPADAGADAADVLSDDKPPIPDIPCEEALRSATSLRVIMHGATIWHEKLFLRIVMEIDNLTIFGQLHVRDASKRSIKDSEWDSLI